MYTTTQGENMKGQIDTTTKNTTNRHRIEMVRIRSLYKRGYITRQQALNMFKTYLEHSLGKQRFVEFPYKVVA